MARHGGEMNPQLDEIYGDVRKLGLEANVAELEAFGYTVVDPERVAAPRFQRRALDAILDVHERYSGQRIEDIDTAEMPAPGACVYHAMVLEGRVFEEMVMNPVVLALGRYLTGQNAILSNFFAILKTNHYPMPMPLHTDSDGVPPPFPQYAQVCNVTWIHTEYTKDNGALAIVPASHRLGRPPTVFEENGYRDDSQVKAVPVEVPAGSIVAWHGNTWHGAFARTNPGVRITSGMYFCRPYYRPQVDIAGRVTDEMLQRNSSEFASIMGRNIPWPLEKDGSNRFGIEGPPRLPAGSGSSVWG